MKQGLLENEYDPMGAAIRDYYETGRAGRLRVFSSQFDEDEMPVATLFRKEDEMPYIERKALELCSGSVLDVGGGAGCYSLALQDRGLDVTAVDISKLSVEVMERRGVKKALAVDLFDESFVGCYILVYGEFVLFSYILDMIGAHVPKLKLCVPFVSALAFRYICRI